MRKKLKKKLFLYITSLFVSSICLLNVGGYLRVFCEVGYFFFDNLENERKK